MGKKLILLGMAVAAVAALAMPAVASASPTLVDHEGHIEPTALIVGTSTNALTTETKFGTLSCQHVEITGEVDTNSNNHVSGHGIGKGKTTVCNSEVGPLTVTEAKLLTMTTSGGDKGTLSMTFIADVGGFECHYEGSGGFTYGTGTNNDSIHITGITLNAFDVCLKEDEDTGEFINPTFEGDFTLTTDETGEPIWIE